MKKIFGFIVTIMLVIGMGSSAFAQSNYFFRFQSRIRQGLINGDLTRREAARLQSRLVRLQHYERRAYADGVLTWHERRFIERERAQLDRAIFNQRHDYQHRYDRDDRWWR